MKLLKFFISRPFFYGAFLFFISNFIMPVDAFAAIDTGPFHTFLLRATKLFYQTRNAIFVVAVFVVLSYAWGAIYEGKIEKEKIFTLILGLVILGVAGWAVSYIADPSQKGEAVLGEYTNLKDTSGWDNN